MSIIVSWSNPLWKEFLWQQEDNQARTQCYTIQLEEEIWESIICQKTFNRLLSLYFGMNLWWDWSRYIHMHYTFCKFRLSGLVRFDSGGLPALRLGAASLHPCRGHRSLHRCWRTHGHLRRWRHTSLSPHRRPRRGKGGRCRKVAAAQGVSWWKKQEPESQQKRIDNLKSKLVFSKKFRPNLSDIK